MDETAKSLKWITILLYIMAAMLIASLWLTVQQASESAEQAVTQSQTNETLLEILTVEQVQSNRRLEALVCVLLINPNERTVSDVDNCIPHDLRPSAITR